MKRKSAGEGTWLDRNVSSSFLLWVGLLFSLIIVVGENLYLKIFQLLVLMFISVLLKKPLGILNKLFLFFFIVIFNVLSPAGEIIARVFSFPITSEALRLGIVKALNIVSLFYLSKIVVRDNVILPGSVGRLIGRTFGFFSRLSSNRSRLRIKSLFSDMDEVFLEAYREDSLAPHFVSEKNSLLGIFVIVVIFLLNLLLLYFLD